MAFDSSEAEVPMERRDNRETQMKRVPRRQVLGHAASTGLVAMASSDIGSGAAQAVTKN